MLRCSFINLILIISILFTRANNENKMDDSDNSEGETEEGDYTVYECPGLAPVSHLHKNVSQRMNNKLVFKCNLILLSLLDR